MLRRIRQAVEEVAAGRFQRAELDEALAYLRGKKARDREGSRALAATLLAEVGVPQAKPEALSLDQLNDTARRLLRNGGPLALVAGPGAASSP